MASFWPLFGLLLALVHPSWSQGDRRANSPPVFLPGGDMANFALREDTRVGTQVYTLRGHDPEGTDVSFSISGDYLSVDRETGVVTLVEPLDREVISSIEVIITVTDGRIFGLEPTTVPLRREIEIKDVNDNRPIFRGGPYAFTVLESVSPGATLNNDIVIQDADAGANARLTLTCSVDETPEACKIFDVREARLGDGEYMGVISLKSALDYESRTKYTIKIIAEDGGGLTSVSNVEVTVIDVQDQPPVLLNAPYSTSLKEGVPKGSRVFLIKARDGDEGNPRPVRLSIEGDDFKYFSLSDTKYEENGMVSAWLVTSSDSLDRENPIIAQNGGIYTFYIRGEEQGGRRESTRSKVTIVVTDEDDQMPYFNSKVANVNVLENLVDGTPLPGLDLVVTDDDIGTNAKFSLELEEPPNARGIFSVYPKSAVGRTPVIVKVLNGSALDFENPNANKFSFKVHAVQNGKRISHSVVNVAVTDANDNEPTFKFESYRFSVEEGSAPGTPIATLTANDSDSGRFSQLRYSLKGFGSEKFVVNSTTGQISVGPCGVRVTCLDYERQTLYSLTYSATDGGGLVTSVNIFIDVLDVNDNPPSFEQVEYRRTVDEGTIAFDPPLYVKATDPDGVNQGDGKVTYTLQDGNTPDAALRVNDHTGEITIQRALTHMDTLSSIYTLVIRATDAGNPPRHSDVRVLITVGRDKNRPPRFTKQLYQVDLKENAKEGTKVATVKARDPDGADKAITYHLSSKGGDHFELDRKSGLIRVTRGALLDRDVEPFFELSVIAVDGGPETRQTSSATVNVTLIDINNKVPIFYQNSYVGHVNERTAKGENVLSIEASDLDLDADLAYDLVGPILAYDKTGVLLKKDSAYDFSSAFSVNESTGEIRVAGVLDHNEASVIVLRVRVKDLMADPEYPLQTDTTEVTIYIQVFSDKNPIFPPPWTPSRPVFEVTLKEEEALGEPLFSVAAKDPSSGRMVRRYEKVRNSDPRNIFNLDPLTGQISLNSRLDYEDSDHKKEAFEVLAIAGDRTSQAEVVVYLEDINDNNPQFSENEYHARLREDARWPKLVLQVSAKDADTGERGRVRYSLGGEDKLLFVINETTGEIHVARGAQLDREMTPTVTLEVTAFDTPAGGVTQRRTTVIVKIELIDVNDEAPSWTKGGKYTAVVAENTGVGSVVLQVEAHDPDLGVNGLVSYQIPEAKGGDISGLFVVDPETGVLSVSSPLSGKGRNAPYELSVRAVDQGTPLQQFSDATITLFIGDVTLNDGVPVFVSPLPNEVASVLENSRDGTAVFQVKAVDADSSDTPNGKIVYSFLERQARDGSFQIDASTGLITTRGKLDREMRAQHSLVVVAQDLGRPPQLTSRVLTINITDADDNDPIFVKLPGKEIYEMEVEEEAATGTVVGYVSALDRDTGENALIDYKISYGNDEALFGINRTATNKGKVYVRGRIDREKIAEVLLTVACGKLGQRIPERRTYDSNDPSLLQVRVKVRDLDDNRPKFDTETQTMGVRMDTPLQTEVLKVTAIDKDPTALPIRYSLYNASITRFKAHPRLELTEVVNGSEIFLLEEHSGVLKTRASLKSFAGDVLTLFVAASSNPIDKPVLTKLTLYVLRDSDLLRFVFDKTPREVRTNLIEFTKDVEETLPVASSLNVYDTAYYSDGDGQINYEKTGSCFQLIGRTLEDTRKLLNSGQNAGLEEAFQKYSVSSIEPCLPRRVSKASVDWVEVWVLVIAAFIGVGAGVASCVVCCLYSKYKRRLRRNQHHMRLLDSPQLPFMGSPSIVPGSIIMLPPPSAGGGLPPPSVMGPPPGVLIQQEPPPRGYEWQERAIPIDAVSYGSIN